VTGNHVGGVPVQQPGVLIKHKECIMSTTVQAPMFETPAHGAKTLGKQVAAICLGGGLNHIDAAQDYIWSGFDVVFYNDYIAVHKAS